MEVADLWFYETAVRLHARAPEHNFEELTSMKKRISDLENELAEARRKVDKTK